MSKKLRICIDLPGNINHGIFSPERGESRWAQNLAWGLAERGHQVTAYSYMYGGPAWGICPQIPNLTLTGYQLAQIQGPYDVFVDNCYWEGKPLVVEAKLNVIGKYGAEEWTKNLGDNFLVATPYNAGWLKEHPKAKWLPAPYWKKLGEPKWSNPGLLLPSRDVCAKGDSVAQNAANVLDVLQSICPSFNISECHFLVSHTKGHAFITNPNKQQEEKDTRERFDLFNRAKKIPSPKFWDLQPWNLILDLLERRIRLNFPLLNPSNLIDSAMKGVPTILWENGGFEWVREIADVSDWKLNYGDPPERIAEVLEMILRYRDIYERLLFMQQDAIRCLEWDPALNIWEREIYARI